MTPSLYPVLLHSSHISLSSQFIAHIAFSTKQLPTLCVACHKFMLSSSEISEKGGMANCFSVTSIQATVLGFSDPHDSLGLLTYMRMHTH